MSPGEGALKLEDILHRDNKKYDTVSDQVQRRADKIKLQKQKSMEVCVVVLCNHLLYLMDEVKIGIH